MLELDISELSLKDIISSINEMNKSACMGPDAIPGNFVINCKQSLIFPLHNLFNKTVKSSCIANI